MIKKKLHTWQTIQNKEDIRKQMRELDLIESEQDEVLRRIREEMEFINQKHKKTMRRLKFQFWVMVLGAITSIVATIYLMIKH